jgi:hypothetical protein
MQRDWMLVDIDFEKILSGPGDVFQKSARLRKLFGKTRAERLARARSIGTHTKQEWQILHDIFGSCVGCGVAYSELIGGGASKDHILPIRFGGCDCIGNLQPVCRQCNSSGVYSDCRNAALPGWQTVYLHRLGAFF